MQQTKSLHIPLPLQWYEKLRNLAKSSNTSATEIVRNRIIELLKEEEKQRISKAIEEFAIEYGGTDFDLDKNLEESSLEFLSKELNEKR